MLVKADLFILLNIFNKLLSESLQIVCVYNVCVNLGGFKSASYVLNSKINISVHLDEILLNVRTSISEDLLCQSSHEESGSVTSSTFLLPVPAG